MTMKTKTKMKESVLLTVFLFLHTFSFVHSQTTDACTNNINFNDIVTFDTNSLSCQPVWNSQGYLLRYALVGPNVWSFLLSAPDSNAWIGIGFSKTGLMIGSSAVVGWVYKNGTGLAKQYSLKAQDTNQVVPDEGELRLVDNSTAAFKQSNVVYLAFQLNTPLPIPGVIYAVGPNGLLPSADGGFKLTGHRADVGTTFNFVTGNTATQSRPYSTLRKTHGALNMLGWGILIPIGAIVARYFKEYDPLWFYTHVTLQCFGSLFGLLGFILGFVTESSTKTERSNHKRLGITIFIFGCCQITAILARPHKGSKYRKYWNWFHHNGGRIVIVLAISNIFYGIHLGLGGVSWYGSYAVILAVLVVASVVLQIRACRKR